MACYYPWFKEGDVHKRPFSCGKCHGCKLEYSRQWAVRCVHEAKCHEFNVFLTLTYKDLPKPCANCMSQFTSPVSLHYCDYQLFMKRLRATGRKVRFYMGGEYGEENGRPHYHAILFNCWFPDMKYWRTSPAGFKMYRSKELDEIWNLGNAEIGMVSFESAAYVARYVLKKMSGDDGSRKYENVVDVNSGEIVSRERTFSKMSLKPGIGAFFLDKYFDDIYPHGTVTINGVQAKAPKFYDKKFRERGYGAYMLLASRRADQGNKYFSETLPNRLRARSEVSSARLGLLKRKS